MNIVTENKHCCNGVLFGDDGRIESDYIPGLLESHGDTLE